MKTKYFSLILISVLCAVFSFGQEKPVLVNSDEILNKGLNYFENGNYNDALKQYQKVPENDTNYYISLVEQVLAYYKLEEYEKGIALGQKALGMTMYLSPELIVDLGCCYDNLEKYEDAVKLYQEGARQFPKSNMMYFNQGYSLSKLNRFAEAFECYKKSAGLNPFHAGTHYALGLMALNEGKTSLSLLAFSTYLLLAPTAQQSNGVLSTINEMTTSKYKEKITSNNIDITDGDDFSETDLLIENYVAMNKKYQVPSKTKYNFIKQLYLLFDKLPENPERKGFWYNTYVPFYKQMLKDEKFDLFATYILQASNSDKDKLTVEKEKSRLISFVDWLKNAWDNLHREYDMEFNNKVQHVGVFRANKGFAISSIGILNSTKTDFTGYAEYYYRNGRIKGYGILNNEAKKEGEWKWFWENGSLQSKEVFNNGEPVTIENYSQLGIISNLLPYKNRKVDGEAVIYTNDGAKDKAVYFKNEILDGDYKEYYFNGQLFSQYANKNGKADGLAKTFFDNGALRSEVNYTNGEKNGPETYYFRNGKIMQKANYVNGMLQGDFITYFDNGKVSDSMRYLNDNPIGGNYKYFRNGTISITADFDESGKLSGIMKEYDYDGKLYYEIEYKKGEILGYKFYNKKGVAIKEDKKKSGTFDFVGYYSTGIMSKCGKYNKDQKQGEWKDFDKNGNLMTTEYYVDDKAQGESKSFFANGAIEKIMNFNKDEAEGYYVQYYKNGNIASQGNYKNNQEEGPWYMYYPDKTPAVENYYIDGKQHGIQKTYALNGIITGKENYYMGVLLNSVNYDTLGNVADSIVYTNACGNKTLHFYKDGPVKSEYNLLYNNIDGKITYYYPNGKIYVEGQYAGGKKNGKWTWYYWNGGIETTGSYDYDEMVGKWEYYFENGKPDRIANYEDDKLNGHVKYYSENGKIASERVYVDDKLEGVSTYYSPEGLPEHKRLYLHDQLQSYSYIEAAGNEKTVEVDNETGEIKTFYKNGKPARQFSMNKGLYQNKYIVYYPTGQIYESIEYLNGEVDGETVYYYPNGQIMEKRHYKSGMLDGLYEEYYPEGKLKLTKNYTFDKLHGKSYYFDKNGNISTVVIYFNNEPVSIENK